MVNISLVGARMAIYIMECPYCRKPNCCLEYHLTPQEQLKLRLQIAQIQAKKEHKTFEEHIKAKLPPPTKKEIQQYNENQQTIQEYQRVEVMQQWAKKKLKKKKDSEN